MTKYLVAALHEQHVSLMADESDGSKRQPLRADETRTSSATTGAEVLFSEVYDELKVIARRELGRAGGNTLNATSLVHELFLKMNAGRKLDFEARPQFFIYAAQAIRHILIDHARRRLTMKLGGDVIQTSLTDPGVDSVAINSQHALQIDSALDALQAHDPRAARVVELHYFAGLPLQRVAEILGVVRRTVDRDWRYARSFLMAHLGLSRRGSEHRTSPATARSSGARV